QILALLNLESFPESVADPTEDTIPNLLERIIDYAVKNDVIEDVFDEKEILSANIMNCFVARPSGINRAFWDKYNLSTKETTHYYYEWSKNSNYIQMNRIRKNIQYNAATKYGEMDITINMSKPQKHPEQIKRERALKQNVHYPICVLCMENEGYEGRTCYAARANHRVIQVQLNNESWYLQYSPYDYYNEHSIL